MVLGVLEVLEVRGVRAGLVLSSDLPRALESASWLSERAKIDLDLREAGLPDRLAIPIRLSPDICVVLARMSWWLNWSDYTEAIADTRRRASKVTERLCRLAREHQSVLVVGHGMCNRFVAGRLRREGWSGPWMLPRGYWSVARFVQNR